MKRVMTLCSEPDLLVRIVWVACFPSWNLATWANNDKMGKSTWTRQKRGKGRTPLCTLCSYQPTCCTFPFWQSIAHTHGHTHFSTQSCDREERGGGRLIKTLRAVLDLTGWVKHTKHRSLLVSTQTHTLTDVSIHLDCHTHTPPRDFTSSVSQLNYSSPFFSSCLSLFSFLSISLTSVWETDSDKDAYLASCHWVSKTKSEVWRSLSGRMYQMCCLML